MPPKGQMNRLALTHARCALLISMLIGALSAQVLAADYQAGVEAYGRGDHAAALREFRPLAEQGHAGAQTGLGFIYANGLGVPQDDAEAVKWLRKASEQDDALAQKTLSSMYALGRGVPQDDVEAVKWLGKAAEQGHADAQYGPVTT